MPIAVNRPLNASFCCAVTPAEPDLGARWDRAVGLELVDDALDGDRRRAGVATGDLCRDRGRRRLVDPGDPSLHVGLVDRGDRAERHLARGPHRQAAQGLERVTLSGSTRTTMSTGSASSNWTRPMGCGVSALRTSPPTWAAVDPTPMALFGSTLTWTSGEALTRSLDRFARPDSASSAARTASDVWATTSASSALMMTLRLLELKPPCWPTVTS